MRAFDTSILVSALISDQACHEACTQTLAGGGAIYQHASFELFNTLTGGSLPVRVSAGLAADLIETEILSVVKVSTLTMVEGLRALKGAESRGVRGGAVYDYLHLVAARKAKAEELVTLNLRHFQSFWRPGDPVIRHPEELA